jgi:hypothetical protein
MVIYLPTACTDVLHRQGDPPYQSINATQFRSAGSGESLVGQTWQRMAGTTAYLDHFPDAYTGLGRRLGITMGSGETNVRIRCHVPVNPRGGTPASRTSQWRI